MVASSNVLKCKSQRNGQRQCMQLPSVERFIDEAGSEHALSDASSTQSMKDVSFSDGSVVPFSTEGSSSVNGEAGDQQTQKLPCIHTEATWAGSFVAWLASCCFRAASIELLVDENVPPLALVKHDCVYEANAKCVETKNESTAEMDANTSGLMPVPVATVSGERTQCETTRENKVKVRRHSIESGLKHGVVHHIPIHSDYQQISIMYFDASCREWKWVCRQKHVAAGTRVHISLAKHKDCDPLPGMPNIGDALKEWSRACTVQGV